MTINPHTGRTLHQSIIDQFAKLDAALSLLTPEDEEALGTWILETGADVSATAKALLLASVISPSPLPIIKKKGSNQNV